MPLYEPVPATPDHPGLEHRILELWSERRTFDRLRDQNRGGRPFSFTDGPITANNPMGVHHAWGRSLKDLFQRYHAMLGDDQRWQNGFDCQGLWVEVEVEKALGLNSKREIESYGLDRFSRACRDRVAEFSAVQARQSERLGMWMDWERSYFTMTDTNIEYIWGFLQECHRQGWLYTGHRPMVWCPRCGTSLSQHELIDSYRDLTHPSLYVYLPLADADGEALVVWTTTPWTLPANCAAAVKPDAEYVAIEAGPGLVWIVAERVEEVFGAGHRIVRRVAGSELVGRPYHGPFESLPAQAEVQPRVIAWNDVGVDEGTGIVHIAPGCGAEDFELGKREGLPVLVPVDEAGAFHEPYGWLHGRHTGDVTTAIVEDLGMRGRLLRAGELTHRFPVCWRCGTELIFRVVDEWFISADGVRERMLAANQTVQWVPEQYGKRMDDWLRNMGDWCISRKRYWGLPLPFYVAPSGELTVVGSVAELRERAVDSLDGLEELHRPWIDGIRIRTEAGEIAERVPEVGDCWLDAGIVPFSTLGWRNDQAVPEGYAKGAGEGLTKADLPDHAYWEKWFPATWVSEMREQIRLWFYSQLFMSVVLDGRAPYKSVLAFEKLNDETGRPMHKSWGNAIWFDDAVEKMGADVMRWLYAGQVPSQNMNFGYGPANDVKKRLLTLWNSYKFFVGYAEIEGFRPTCADLEQGPPTATSLDRYLVARVNEAAASCGEALDGYWTPAYVATVESLVDDLSNWYIRGSRARFWRSGAEDQDAAFRTLWYALVQVARLIAPTMPFLADELWQNLVARHSDELPDSVHLTGFPARDERLHDAGALASMRDAQDVIRLGRKVRSEANHKLRQPLAEVIVSPRNAQGRASIEQHSAEIAAELNVKGVRVADRPEELVEVEVVPNFRALGPRLGKDMPTVKRLLSEGQYTRRDGVIEVGDHELGEGDYDTRSHAREGYEVADEGSFVVALDVRLTDELVDEGIARDLVHVLQAQRRDAGFEVTDRIRVAWAGNDRARRVLERHGPYVAAETLAVELAEAEPGDTATPFEAEGASLRVAVRRA